MTRWPRRLPPAPVEPPAWFHTFDPAAWSEPDEWELQMGGERLPPDIRRWYRERRWHAARREWILANPEYDWLAELRERRERRRQPTTR